jgi:hypothetical protein
MKVARVADACPAAVKARDANTGRRGKPANYRRQHTAHRWGRRRRSPWRRRAAAVSGSPVPATRDWREAEASLALAPAPSSSWIVTQWLPADALAETKNRCSMVAGRDESPRQGLRRSWYSGLRDETHDRNLHCNCNVDQWLTIWRINRESHWNPLLWFYWYPRNSSLPVSWITRLLMINPNIIRQNRLHWSRIVHPGPNFVLLFCQE